MISREVQLCDASVIKQTTFVSHKVWRASTVTTIFSTLGSSWAIHCCLAIVLVMDISHAAAQQKIANDDKSAKMRYRVARETTRVTKPLSENGRINFVEALNQEFSKGVTHDNNAAAVIVPILPVDDSSQEMRKQLLDQLECDLASMDMNLPPSLTTLSEYARQNGLNLEELTDHYSDAMDKPWSDEDYPQLATWLHGNEKALDKIAEATKLQRFFIPYLSDDEDDILFTQMAEEFQTLRDVARQLNARAMRGMRERNWDDAWSDIMAIKRLGHHVGSGQTLIHGLIGSAITGIGCHTAAIFVTQHPPNDRLDWQAALNEWQKERVVADLKRQYDFGERLSFIQVVVGTADEKESLTIT